MSALTAAVRAGRTGETVDLLAGMTDAERRAHVPDLKELRKELRKAPWDAQSRKAYPALHAAGVACQSGAAAVASWIAANDMRWTSAPPAVLLQLLADRPADWLADVTDRLARRPPATDVPYELMAGLVRMSGCPVPTTEAFVIGWVEHTGRTWQRGSLEERLRSDAYLAPLVAALFETDDIGSRLEWSGGGEKDAWAGALARLTAEGALERKAVVDGCLARLLRGGTSADSRVFLLLLRLLDLTPQERRERTADWLALAADAVSPVAGHAQSVLAASALDGELTARQLAEMSGAVLFRPEKKLVRAQLVLLGKALARDTAAADELLPGVAQAFGHSDPDVQERALKLVERHLKNAGSVGTRDELSLMAEQLIPELRARAAGLLGAGAVPGEHEPYEETLPPFLGPVRLAVPPRTAEEAAEEVSAALASAPSVAEFERALDGLVRHVYHDQDALVRALEPVFARCWWDDGDRSGGQDSAERAFNTAHGGLFSASDGLELVLATLRDRIRTRTLHAAVHHGTPHRDCWHAALTRAFDARLWEVAYLVRTRPVPFLLSTPTWSTGLLEPDELVDRLDTYRRLGARAGQADFAQALLRVRRGDRAAAATAADRAAALGTPEGSRLARWLTAEVPVLRTTRRTHMSRILVELGELADLQEDFPAEFRPLGRPTNALRNSWYCFHHGGSGRPRHWLALLPERRELVAGRLLSRLSDLAVEDGRGDGACLPLLAEADGEAGEAVHLGLAYGLCARHPEDRLAAVDALLTLAARGQLDPIRLATDLRQLVRSGAAKPLRLAESARTAAATGACATVWGVLRHVLPALLAGPSAGTAPARGLGDLLGVAAECVERSGAGGEVRYLTETADRRGSSQLLTQARRLRAALAFAAAA